MPVRRERVDVVRTPDSSELAHRRWIFPDDVYRPIGPSAVARLWRALVELNVACTAAEPAAEELSVKQNQTDRSGHSYLATSDNKDYVNYVAHVAHFSWADLRRFR